MGEFVNYLKNEKEVASVALFHDIIKQEADLEFLLEELQGLEMKV